MLKDLAKFIKINSLLQFFGITKAPQESILKENGKATRAALNLRLLIEEEADDRPSPKHPRQFNTGLKK